MIISYPRLLLSAGMILQLISQASRPAQNPPIVVETSVDYQYADFITFQALIQPSQNLSRVAVFFRPQGSSDTKILLASLNGDDPALASATHDLHTSPIQPFSEVVYWWHVDFADGSSHTTDPQTFDYIDNRFAWASLSQPPLTVLWTDGDLTLAQAALDIGEQALKLITDSLYLRPPDQLRIYLYPSLQELQTGLQLAGRIWAGAHAATDLGVILLSVSSGTEGRLQLERDLPHELTHVLLYQRMGSAYEYLPTWLNEGLATLNEADPQPQYRIALETAISQDTLMPLPSLCSAFPTEGSEAMLAYAQSASVVQYIQDVYGSGAIVALLDAYQEGATCLGALQRVLRRSAVEFDAEYSTYMSPPRGFWTGLRPYTSLILISGLALVAIFITVLLFRQRRSRNK